MVATYDLIWLGSWCILFDSELRLCEITKFALSILIAINVILDDFLKEELFLKTLFTGKCMWGKSGENESFPFDTN